MNSVVQVIVTTPNGMSAGSAFFSREARQFADTLSENILEVQGKKINIVPQDAYYLFTNLHVVNGANTVSIRLPSMHQRDIPVSVIGYSDLDIACLRLSGPYLDMVKKRLGHIEELEFTDSDDIANKITNVITRGYPMGTENQMITKGVISGIKHINGEEYIVTDAEINPGNSGGPLLRDGKVIGINVMKVVQQGIEGINVHIPSNRVKLVLPYLVDNHINDLQVKAQEIAIASMQAAQGLGEHIRKIFACHFADTNTRSIPTERWKNVMYKSENGSYKEVTFKEWIQTLPPKKSYKLITKVITHLQNNEIEKIHSMRRRGFDAYLECADRDLKVKIQAQPRVIHLPRLQIHYSNTNEAAQKFYNTDKLGVIIHKQSGPLLPMDYLHAITTDTTYPINRFGEWFFEKTGTALTINDIIKRTKFGTNIKLHVIRDGQHIELSSKYDILKDNERPELRIEMNDKVVELQGVVMKQIRLQDTAIHPNLNIEPYQVAFYINSVDPRTTAFHDYTIQAGDMIKTVNGIQPTSILQIAQECAKDFVVLHTKSGVHIFQNT